MYSSIASKCRAPARRSIGYLTSNIHNPVQQLGWRGVADAACDLDANLICLVGDVLGAPGFRAQANVAYDLVGGGRMDGLLIHASALSPYVGCEGMEDFVQRYRSLPLVSSAGPLADIPCVSVGRRQGVHDVVTHLIEVHGCRRIAFVRGPKDHAGAQARYQGYLDALADYGLPLDPHLVTPPSTGWVGSREQVEPLARLLLDERGLRPRVDFDAIASDSDDIAIVIIEVLQERGVQVPEDVAVVGYNDITENQIITPALTTARPPFYEKGRRAAELLLAHLRREPVPQELLLPSEVVVRESCGCADPTVAQAAVGAVQVSNVDLWATLASAGKASTGKALTGDAVGWDEIVADMARAAPGHAGGAEWAGRLLDSFVAALTGDSPGLFLRELREALRRHVAAGDDVAAWQDALSSLRRRLLPHLGGETLNRAEDLWQQARALIGEMAWRAQACSHWRAEQRAQALRAISQTLITIFDVEELMDALAYGLPRLGIPGCYLALYEDPRPMPVATGVVPQQAPAWARLVLAYGENGRVELEPTGQRFPSRQLLPDGMWPQRRCSFVVEPLYFREDQLGFVLFEVGPREGMTYELLRTHISNSLKGALLFDETRRARAAAEKADRLKTRLLANVSHELRAPLNVILGCTREVLDSPTPYGATVPPALVNDVQRVRQSAEHQLRLINDLLDLSRAEIDELGLYPEMIEPKALLEEAFHSIARTCPSDVAWHLQVPERLPAIQADPLRLRQILLNLLSNAGKFVEQGQIVLGAAVEPPHLHIWVHDTGPGIPQELQERIFEPFATAHLPGRRSEGIGLGLSITRRLVALHRGCLELESQPGQGSTFHVYLPLPTLGDQPPVSLATVQPALLLLSSGGQPPVEVVEFSRRRGLEIHRLRASDDLEAVVERLRPAALAWDLAAASPEDWMIVRRLRNHPRLSQAAFMLYGPAQAEGLSPSVGMTSFVAKSPTGSSLLEVISGLCPPGCAGPILLVDDDAGFLELYRGVVEKGLPGYGVRTASDGAAALALMVEETPCLVVLDLAMPEMDGFEVLDWMRTHERTRQVPVLVLSQRVLTLDDVKRLERHARVTLQSKGIWSEDETVAALHRALFGSDALPQSTGALVKRVVAYLQQHYARALSRWEIAEAVGVSEDYVSRLFRQELGLSPWEYLKRYRVLQAQELLRCTDDNVKTVARRVGFDDPAYFSRVFHRVTGLSPTAYRDQCA